MKKYHAYYCNYKRIERFVRDHSQEKNELSSNNLSTYKNNISNMSLNDSRINRPPPQYISINYNDKISNIPPPQNRAYYEIVKEVNSNIVRFS